jgi:solute carrier family 25 aspartate/glutamate transporter 12/13
MATKPKSVPVAPVAPTNDPVATSASAMPLAKPPKVPLPYKLVVGAVAGVFGTTCIYPLDMVKTRLQTGKSMYSGPLTTIRSILQHEGVRGFYKGLVPNLVGVTPEKAIKLAANDVFREMLESENGSMSLVSEMAAGAGAGLCQVIATNPMEITKIRMQMQATLPVEQRQTTMQVVNGLGIRGLYQGSLSTLSRDIPFSLIFFPAYANIKKYFADDKGNNSIGSLLLSGGIAGATGSFFATPADVIKTRLQLVGGKERYGNMANCFKTVLREEGVGALFAGCIPRMCVVAPLFGIALLSFELQKEYMIKSGLL